MKKVAPVLLLFLVILACNLPLEPSATLVASATPVPSATSVASATPVPSATGVPSPTTVTSATSVPSATTGPTATVPTATPVPTSTPVPTDAAEFIMDVTIPDGTMLNPGVSFIKTWRLRNSGGTTWTTAYSLIFASGEHMGGLSVIPLSSNVAPGGVIDVSVALVAPSTPGTHVGYWELRSATGILFGVGTNADKPFLVNIKVSSPPPAFAVVSALTSVSPSLYNKKCPAEIKVKSVITTNGAGTVTGQWNYSTGISHDFDPLVFGAADSQTISIVLDFNKLGPGDKYSGWVRVYIDTPNHQYFNKASFNIVCTK